MGVLKLTTMAFWILVSATSKGDMLIAKANPKIGLSINMVEFIAAYKAIKHASLKRCSKAL